MINVSSFAILCVFLALIERVWVARPINPWSKTDWGDGFSGKTSLPFPRRFLLENMNSWRLRWIDAEFGPTIRLASLNHLNRFVWVKWWKEEKNITPCCMENSLICMHSERSHGSHAIWFSVFFCRCSRGLKGSQCRFLFQDVSVPFFWAWLSFPLRRALLRLRSVTSRRPLNCSWALSHASRAVGRSWAQVGYASKKKKHRHPKSKLVEICKEGRNEGMKEGRRKEGGKEGRQEKKQEGRCFISRQ